MSQQQESKRQSQRKKEEGAERVDNQQREEEWEQHWEEQQFDEELHPGRDWEKMHEEMSQVWESERDNLFRDWDEQRREMFLRMDKKWDEKMAESRDDLKDMFRIMNTLKPGQGVRTGALQKPDERRREIERRFRMYQFP